jgi:hypothetical protein
VAGNGTPGFADGGIATGSKSGYNANLHGTEAVIPLPDGKSVPVQLAQTATPPGKQTKFDTDALMHITK